MFCTFRGKRFFRHTFHSAHFVDLLQRTHVNLSISSKKGPSVVGGMKGFSIGNSNPSVTNGNAFHSPQQELSLFPINAWKIGNATHVVFSKLITYGAIVVAVIVVPYPKATQSAGHYNADHYNADHYNADHYNCGTLFEHHQQHAGIISYSFLVIRQFHFLAFRFGYHWLSTSDINFFPRWISEGKHGSEKRAYKSSLFLEFCANAGI